MICPRCARDTEERAAFCGSCGAPLTLQDEPPPRRLDLTLDLDRRGARTPAPGAAAPQPPSLPELRRDAVAALEPEPVAARATPPSHWDLGRALAAAGREEGYSVGPTPPRAPAAPVAPARRAPPSPAPVAAAESAALAWSEPEEEEDVPEVAFDREIRLGRPATWRRVLAWAIDAGPFAGGVAYFGKSLLATASAGLPAPAVGLDGLLDLLARESDIVLPLAALLALSLAVYATLAHALAGATLGKWVLGLRVVGPDGRRPSLARSAARAALAGVSVALLGLGFLLALFTRSGRSLHDLLARTWVVVAP